VLEGGNTKDRFLGAMEVTPEEEGEKPTSAMTAVACEKKGGKHDGGSQEAKEIRVSHGTAQIMRSERERRLNW
jgi:hypothetical protein